MTPLTGWQNFYVIVGSSAGALIGLQFVVIALLANLPRGIASGQGASAFATPNVIHFGTVLLLSAILSAPWHRIDDAAILWGFVGLVGAIYEVVIIWRMRTQIAYRPEFEDWLCHVVLPFAAYATLAVSAVSARSHTDRALTAVAVAVLVLLFAGIHNAWDAATYHIFVARPRHEDSERPKGNS
jgi:hypothetical protein